MKRHNTIKHVSETVESSSSKLELTLDEVVSVVNKGARVLSADMCYPQNIRDELSKFELTVASNPCKFLVAETQKLVESCKKKADPEKLYAKFFEMMPFKTEKFFPSLSQKAGMLLILKFADCLLSLVKEKLTKKDTVSSMQVHKKVLSDKEHHALEYLSGYVLSLVICKRLKTPRNLKLEHVFL